MGRPRSARQARGRARRRRRQAGPHVPPALPGHAGGRRRPRGAGVADDPRASGRRVGGGGPSARGPVADHSGSVGLVSAARSTARTCTVTALLKSSELGTTTRSPVSVFNNVTLILTSVTVPEPAP